MYSMAYVEHAEGSRPDSIDDIGAVPKFRIEYFDSIDDALARAKELFGAQGTRSIEIYSRSGAIIFDENQLVAFHKSSESKPPGMSGR